MNFKTVMSAAFSVVFLVCSGLSAENALAADDKPQPDQTIVFKKVGDVELAMHVFNPPVSSGQSESADRTARPAIVFFFGGGWTGGSPSQFYGQSRALADLGMVAMCAEYRVRKTHGTTPQECVRDGKSAIRWARKNADRLGIDPNRIAAGGGSAGGHVAAATATVAAFDAPDDDLNVSARPDALVLFNPVYDNGPEGYGHDRVKDYWKEISPLHRLDDQMPPTIVFLGTKDKLIPVETGKKFHSRLNELGIQNELHLYKDATHGFFNKGEPYEDTLQKSIDFLTDLGFISQSNESAAN